MTRTLSEQDYIDCMREEAAIRRVLSEKQTGDEKDWLLGRAAFFDQCAAEAEAKSSAILRT